MSSVEPEMSQPEGPRATVHPASARYMNAGPGHARPWRDFCFLVLAMSVASCSSNRPVQKRSSDSPLLEISMAKNAARPEAMPSRLADELSDSVHPQPASD